MEVSHRDRPQAAHPTAQLETARQPPSSCCICFRLRLARYEYTVEHVPGAKLYTADALSRAPVARRPMMWNDLSAPLNNLFQPLYY